MMNSKLSVQAGGRRRTCRTAAAGTCISEQKLYVLALQWGISFCRNNSGSVSCRKFTIHGFRLYKEGAPNTFPPKTATINLSTRRSEYNQVLNNIQGLSENWPSLLTRITHFRFWSEQWLKHGRALGLLPQEYFQKAINLKKQIENELGRRSLEKFLIEQGLPPDDEKLYHPNEFINRITNKAGVVPQIHCTINNEGVYQLEEIRFYFNVEWELTHYPEDQSNNVQGILFPASPRKPAAATPTTSAASPPPLPDQPATSAAAPPSRSTNTEYFQVPRGMQPHPPPTSPRLIVSSASKQTKKTRTRWRRIDL
ncbi:hypothetical protein M9H77_21514 [Catharanthus roseus]|uniref:Uncharacterized protein n=1 Tax=Catharanthus roseus TaxID=4058 RepID=A0ACC0ARV8_CATRO|nr:hypothetical protein M9H77_21514 [Catharanthus roseus]